MAFISNKKNNIDVDNELLNIRITFAYLEMFIRYLFEENENIVSKRNKKNLQKLLEMIDYKTVYEREPNELYYYKALIIICNFTNNRHIDDPQVIYDYLTEEVPETNIPQKIINDIFNFLSSEEYNLYDKNRLQFITEYVESKLNYINIYKKIDPLQESINNLKSDNGKSTIECINELDLTISDLFHKMKQVKTDINGDMTEFDSTNEENAEEILDKVINEKKNPHSKLLTPWQSFNKMVGGGIEKGRCYLLFGLPKHFKSGSLLNIALGICKYNKGYKLKDPTKKPIVYYFTQENTVKETLERLLDYCNITDIDNLTGKEALDLINSFIQEESGIGFKFKYKPNKSINTSYLYELVDKSAEDGYEVICMVQDYTKRIRSSASYPDIRLELGEVVNDFCVFAKNYDIPIISAGQLNREAYRVLELYNSKNWSDVGKGLNASHIGESALMLENTDVGIIINREKYLPSNIIGDENDTEIDEKYYLSFKLLAGRGKDKNKGEDIKEYFAQPFVEDNNFRIKEDLYLDEPLSVDSIGSDLERLPSSSVISERISNLNNTISNGIVTGRRFQNSKIEINDNKEELFNNDLFVK